MSQDRIITGALGKAGPPHGLAAFEAKFLALRQAAPDLGSAFVEAFSTATGFAAGSPSPLWQAGKALVAAIEAHPGKTMALPYHNLHHFAEATLAMGLLCATARELGLVSAADAALGVVAMVGHDIEHDGVSLGGGTLEAHAAAEVVRTGRAAGVGEAELTLLAHVIEGTDPALVADNQARMTGALPPGPFGVTGDWLRALANEADVMASLMPELGLRLGDALASEGRLAGDPDAEVTASFQGRLAFLRRFGSLTPAAAALGVPALVKAQIAGFAAAARRLPAAATPEQAAAELDRMDRPAARARYLAAVSAAAMTRDAAEPGAGGAVHPPRRFRISLTVTILAAFSLVFVTVMGFTAFATYRQSMRAAIASARHAMADLTSRTAARTAALVEPLYATVAIAPVLPDIALRSGSALGPTETAFRGLLAVLPEARAVSAASAEGALLQMLEVDAMSAGRRRALGVPAGASLAVRGVAVPIGEVRIETWRFLDPEGHVLAQREIDGDADPRSEIWFRTARNSEGIATTVLHMLPGLDVPGLSIVRRMPQGGALGIAVALDSLGGFLAEQQISPRSSAFIIDDNGILIAHSDRSVAMSSGAPGEAPSWITIASSADPNLRAFWINFATGRLAPGRTVELAVAGEAYLARIAPLDRVGSPPSLVGVVAPVTDFTGPIERARDITLLLFLVAGAVGLGLITFVARRITRPLAELTHEAEAIRRFDLEQPLTVSSHITEVARLATTMQAMKSALHTFGLYVPKFLVRELVSGDGRARLGGERRELSVMFTDIVGFTTIADGLDAEHLMRLTSEYFEGMTQVLMGAGGTIDKYIGDAVMALWNAPSPDEQHAAHACLAALRCREHSARMALEFAQRGWPALRTRLGVNTGEAVVGNVGSSDRMSYTAIGATVNMASRLEGLNKLYDTQILVTEATRAAAGADFVFRRVDRVLPKGRQKPTDIHELLGLRRVAEPRDATLLLPGEDIAWAADWDRLVAAYLDRRFADARELLQTASVRRHDGVSILFAQRLEACIATPPAQDWDGVSAYHEK